MNSFRELQDLYEGYRGVAVDFDELNSKFAPRSDIKNSYYGKGQLPTGVPGNAGNAYSFNQTNMSFEDEDETVISKSMIVKKINALLADAEERGMSFAGDQLFDLLTFIEEL
jgi:hypothetical protein